MSAEVKLRMLDGSEFGSRVGLSGSANLTVPFIFTPN